MEGSTVPRGHIQGAPWARLLPWLPPALPCWAHPPTFPRATEAVEMSVLRGSGREVGPGPLLT